MDLEQTIQEAAKRLLALRDPAGRWDFHPHLGPHFLAQYCLCLKWLDWRESDLDESHLIELLSSTQLADGSWYQVRDVDVSEGDLNATIFNYWALKALGVSVEAGHMRRARSFILSKGGIEASALFTKTFLALFANYPWRKLTYVPYFVFLDHLPFSYKKFSQWVIPHLMPMAYLRHNHVLRDLGPNFQLQELWVGKPPPLTAKTKAPRLILDLPLIKKILGEQQPHGSWGGYTVSTLMTVMALRHFRPAEFLDPKVIDEASARGIAFVDRLYTRPGAGAYQGCLMDGHYWDTLLVGNALLEAGVELKQLKISASYIQASQQPNGGYPYGYDFEYAPDVDDTAEAMMMLKHWPEHNEAVSKAGKWLLSMQNEDGGWGAFDRNNVGNTLLRLFSRAYRDSVDLFDSASADSTGHVLDALSLVGHNRHNSAEVRKGIEHLKATQDKQLGAWKGRWAINYLFGTTCALVGLLKAGESAKESYIKKSLAWLISRQNADGGFGESTRSYSDKAWAGRGTSTPSQTAWVLWALNCAGLSHTPAAKGAVQFLLNAFSEDPALPPWPESSVTGTGHPGLLYMNYPSYPAAFPLHALCGYRRNITPTSGV
jgi:squalene-hopene/tetraprenyl-beta-curcumene cyclase